MQVEGLLLFCCLVVGICVSEALYCENDSISMAEAKRMTKEDQPRCINCGYFIDDCKCVCPYCGESAKCTCCIGNDKATGGG